MKQGQRFVGKEMTDIEGKEGVYLGKLFATQWWAVVLFDDQEYPETVKFGCIRPAYEKDVTFFDGTEKKKKISTILLLPHTGHYLL